MNLYGVIHTIINGKRVPVDGVGAQDVVASDIFVQWCARIDQRFAVQKIIVQSVDYAERDGKTRVLFAKFVATFSVLLNVAGSLSLICKARRLTPSSL